MLWTHCLKILTGCPVAQKLGLDSSLTIDLSFSFHFPSNLILEMLDYLQSPENIPYYQDSSDGSSNPLQQKSLKTTSICFPKED